MIVKPRIFKDLKTLRNFNEPKVVFMLHLPHLNGSLHSVVGPLKSQTHTHAHARSHTTLGNVLRYNELTFSYSKAEQHTDTDTHAPMHTETALRQAEGCANSFIDNLSLCHSAEHKRQAGRQFSLLIIIPRPFEEHPVATLRKQFLLFSTRLNCLSCLAKMKEKPVHNVRVFT